MAKEILTYSLLFNT